MEGMTDFLKNVVDFLVKKLVDEPKDVQISVTTSTKSVLVQIKTRKQDTGKVIGKKGRTIDSIKVLLSCIKNTQFPGDGRKVLVEVLEDENQTFVKNNKKVS